MASPVSAKKRKRKSHLTTPNKRRRTLQSPASTPASEVTDPPTQEQEVFPARRILQESARKYLVDWEDHPITGEKYPPSWEWKKDVGAGLIADWEAHQKKTSQTTTEADEASDDCTEQPPSAPPSRRRPVIPSSSPSAQQTEPEESTSRVPLDTPSPDLGAFVEQTGGPAGSWSYHTSTQEVPSTYVSDSVALGTNSQFNTTEEESGTGEDTQSGAQETGTSQEGSNSYHPEPSASVDQGNSTDNTNPENTQPERLNSSGSAPSPHGPDQSRPNHSTESQGTGLPDSYSQDDFTAFIEIPESPVQEEPQSLEQAIDTQSQEHIAETQSPLKSRASSVGGASEELLEPDTQVEEEGVRDIDEGVLLDLSQEQRDTTPEPKSSGPAIDTEPSERHIEETQGPVKSRESPVSSASEESAESGIPSAGERIEEAAINTEPLTHIEEKQGPVEARESSVSALSEEGEEPGKQSVEKRIEEVDKHPLSESSPEEQNNISSPQVQEKYVVEPPVDKGKQASITTGESVRKELTQQPDSVTELEEAAATASADQESATHTIPERDFIPKAAVGPVAEPSIAYRGFPYDPIARTTPAYKRLPYDPVTATGTASKEQPYNPITASETASRGLPYDPVIASKTAPQGLPYDPTQDANTKRRDFAIVSQTDIGTTQDITSDKEPTQLVVSNPSSTRQEQHAQVVHTSPYLSTQNNSLGLVLPTTEELDLAESDHATPKSRHDSSQEETPKPEEISKAKVSSEDISIPPAPPSTSFEEFDSLAPAALRTPVTVSPLLTNMAEKEPEVEQMSDVKRRFHAIFEKNREQSGSSGVTGTRSPSIIPDKSPQQAGPPSLRNVAALNSALVQGTDTPGKLVSKPDPTVPEVSSPPVLDTLNVGSETNADAVEDQSDGDVSSDLEDDLILLRNEYIVPTAMESIQKSTYDAKVTKHKEILTGFVKDPHSFQAMGDLKKFFSEIIAIETHVDFDIPESSQDNAGTQSQTRWTEDTAAKFRFLGLFLHQLRHMELRVILVVKEENDHLFSLIEKFLKGKTINYYNRARQRGAAPKEWDGSLQVEILPSEPSYVAQPADVIVCLDDVTAADVRRKSWARNHDRADPLVTVLRLVVPRSLSHIQLCVSPKLSEKDRLHREAACLLQFRGLYGRPLSPKTPRPHEAAEIVAQYIMELDNVEGRPDWPLPGIGSVKEVVEYASPQTQTTTDSAASSIRGVSTKRQLSRSPGAPTKRARVTSTAEAETTHISDSMPGTAAEGPSLQEQLAEMQKKVELAQDNERRALAIAKASAKRTQELDATLNDRQTNYEDLSKQFRLTTSALENEKLQKERALTRSVNSDERNKKLNAEIADLKTKLSALQASNMSSPDEKAAEIARLQKENEDMAKKLNSALKDKSSADSMLEYIKDELRTAQSQAAEWKSRCEAANSELEHLQPIAAGEVTKTKEIHYQRSTELLRQQYEHTKMVNLKMEKVLQQKEEEIQRLKGGARDRYGTRQSSVPRSPRVGSRAGSPAPRDRVSNLRNG